MVDHVDKDLGRNSGTAEDGPGWPRCRLGMLAQRLEHPVVSRKVTGSIPVYPAEEGRRFESDSVGPFAREKA